MYNYSYLDNDTHTHTHTLKTDILSYIREVPIRQGALEGQTLFVLLTTSAMSEMMNDCKRQSGLYAYTLIIAVISYSIGSCGSALLPTKTISSRTYETINHINKTQYLVRTALCFQLAAKGFCAFLLEIMGTIPNKFFLNVLIRYSK